MATCEELGFSPEECKNLSAEDKEALGITGGTTTYKSRTSKAIDSDADLKKYIRDFKNVPLLSIINQLQKKGLHLSSGYYKELQDDLLKQEKSTGVAASILSGAEGVGPTIAAALWEG